MKRKIFTFCLSTGLAFALSMGAVGCMITGFDLALANESTVIFACLLSALLCSGLLQLPHGGKVLAALAFLSVIFLWIQGKAAHQFLSLAGDLTLMYHRAYQWGWLDVGSRGAAADIPMAVIGTAVSLCACRTVCRGKDTWLTVLMGALPLALCLVVTNTVPQQQFLFCLLAPMILLILSSALRQEDTAQSNRLTALAAVPAVLALAGLFLAVPQEGYVNRAETLRDDLLHYIDYLPQIMEEKLAQVATELQSGDSKDVNLRNLGPRPQYTHTVMEVTADTGGILYLRGQDYDTYTGTGWTATPHRAESLTCQGEDLGNVTVSTRSGKDLLYTPYYPDETVVLAGGMVHNNDNLRTYSFHRTGLPENWDQIAPSEGDAVPEYTPAEIPAASDLERLAFGSTAERLRYLTLPGETKIEAQKILAAFLDKSQSRPEQARAIADYVRNCAAYNLDTPRMPSNEEDFALWFLQDGDTGYCVHFATAAVVLLRAADIPARYVTGYMVEAAGGETAKVSAGNSHAWAEYYMPNLGTWVVLDATPGDIITEETVTETEASAPPVTRPTEEETLPPATETEAPLPTETAFPTETQPVETPEPEARRGGGWWLLLVGLVLLIIAQRYLRLNLRSKCRSRGTANEQALFRWWEAAVLARLLKEEVPRELYDLAQKAKFSQHTLQKEEIMVFEAYLLGARRRLRKNPWYLQLLYRWFWVVY